MSAQLNVSLDYCWYLDETFCYSFHRLVNERGLETLRHDVFAICMLIMGVAGSLLLCLGCKGCLPWQRENLRGRRS